MTVHCTILLPLSPAITCQMLSPAILIALDPSSPKAVWRLAIGSKLSAQLTELSRGPIEITGTGLTFKYHIGLVVVSQLLSY